MAINISEFMSDPLGTMVSPFTDLFFKAVGNGDVFYLFPFIILAFGIQVKLHNPMMTTAFIVTTGTLIAGGSFYTGAATIGVVFTIFVAIGLTGMIASILFQRS